MYACHIINSLPTAMIKGKTPLKVWYGSPTTDYDSLHIYGCPTYYHVKESKLDHRVRKYIFLGLSSGVKGYKLWCPDIRKIVKPIKQVEESTVESD